MTDSEVCERPRAWAPEWKSASASLLPSLVDVGLVILFFVPSLMVTAQKYNWLPAKVRRAADEISGV